MSAGLEEPSCAFAYAFGNERVSNDRAASEALDKHESGEIFAIDAGVAGADYHKSDENGENLMPATHCFVLRVPNKPQRE